MRRSVVALINGYSRFPELYDVGIAQLLKLRGRGLIDRIVYVTWDSPRLDDRLRPLAKMPDVELVRIPEPDLPDVPLQTRVAAQIRNLESSLALVADDALVLKTRPDFIFGNEDFLAHKIENFETLCAPSDLPERLGLSAPPCTFERKIWIPWANAAEPLLIGDTFYLGLKQDLAKLADRAAERYLTVLKDGRCDRMSHIARPLALFEPHYPILKRYGENIRTFISTIAYRDNFSRLCRQQPFFRYLALINAWILTTHFHVDGGNAADLIFFPERTNPRVMNWQNLKTDALFASFEAARSRMTPGSFNVCCQYPLATLASDDWARALFTADVVDDCPHAALLRQLGDAIAYDRGQLGANEDAFYAAADACYRTYQSIDPPVMGPEGAVDFASRCRREGV